MKATVTQHVYVHKWYLENLRNGIVEANAFSIRAKPDKSTSYMFYLCPVEVEVTIPDQEAARLMEIGGIDMDLGRLMDQSLELRERRKELLALPSAES